MTTTTKTYTLDGTILEACSCGGPCPCWVGDDPDGGTCSSFVAYHVDRGQINGVGLADLSVVEVCQIPGNVLKGNWRVVLYVDDKATPEQREALLAAFSGTLGGPLSDLAALKQYVVIEDCPIEHRVEGGKGSLRVIGKVTATMEPYRDAQGRPTTLHDSIFSTIPGSPAYLAKASEHRVSVPEHDMVWEFTGRNAIQGAFHFEA
jgi:hypothetical protein